MHYDDVVSHLKMELAKINTGRASTNLVEDIDIEVYGSPQKLKGIASISVQDSKTILIQPWDKGAVTAIEKAIQTSDLGINPQIDGTNIRLIIPALTEERRRELVKIVHKTGEEARISIRNLRQKELHAFEGMELPEDELKREKDNLQEDVNIANKEIDEIIKKKESDVMTV